MNSMTIGLLWFDNDKSSDLSAKVQRASEHYRRRFGRKPELCFINPRMVGTATSEATPVEKVGGVELATSHTILMHHFWLGQREPIATA